MARSPNRLQHEQSPYLQQHALNPVDWYPWGEEAFTRARQDMKPVFLSVGYSTCHWCHVMERESFQNNEIASLLNTHFVSIKVDREERPDVDRIYMTALQAMGQHGGWPMSMFLTPDRRPFYGGTYYPPETLYGRAGFPDVLRRIHQVWTEERDTVMDSAGRITRFLEDLSRGGDRGRVPDTTVLDRCCREFTEMFDPQTGGFGGAPKFPRPSVFEFLLRHHARTGNARALEMVESTIWHLAHGGVTDQVGGGFHRYAVDAEWRVPHFEKMLYDQAQLARTLADLYQITKNEFYAELLRKTLDYVRRDLTGPAGGFFSAEDADSPRPEDPAEQGEGAFYVWTAKEINQSAGKDAELFSYVYGVEQSGNVPVDPQHEFTGRNILYVAQSVDEAAAHFGRDRVEIRSALEASLRTLREARKTRPRPRLDDKIIASWNGLMIEAFSRASWVLRDSDLLDHARRAGEFVLTALVDQASWTVHRRYRGGDARFEGQLDDYMALAAGLLALFEISREARWLIASIKLTEKAITIFNDPATGALFDSPGTDPSVLVRMKEHYDGAEPTGNSLAALHMLRLSQLTGNVRWREHARQILEAYAPALERQPAALPYMLAALDLYHCSGQQIVIAGNADDPLTCRLLEAVSATYLPSAAILMLDGSVDAQELLVHIPWAKEYTRRTMTAQAYVCRDYRCELPTADPEVLAGLLRTRGGAE